MSGSTGSIIFLFTDLIMSTVSSPPPPSFTARCRDAICCWPRHAKATVRVVVIARQDVDRPGLKRVTHKQTAAGKTTDKEEGKKVFPSIIIMDIYRLPGPLRQQQQQSGPYVFKFYIQQKKRKRKTSRGDICACACIQMESSVHKKSDRCLGLCSFLF